MRDDAKANGERIEVLFCLRALEQGLNVSRPLGDNQKYDAITDDNGRLVRVQIKSTSVRSGRGYLVSTKSGGPTRRQSYSGDYCDILAVYLVALDEWHLLPVELVVGKMAMTITSDEFKEAWHLLKYG